MSKHEIIIQMLKGIEQTLAQQALGHDLVHKDVLNTREAALYMGRSVCAIYKLRSRCKLPGYKPSNGKLYFYKVELFDWMLSDSLPKIPGRLMQLEAPEEVPAEVVVPAEEEASDEEEEEAKEEAKEEAEEEEEARIAILNQEGG